MRMPLGSIRRAHGHVTDGVVHGEALLYYEWIQVSFVVPFVARLEQQPHIDPVGRVRYEEQTLLPATTPVERHSGSRAMQTT